MKYTLKTTLLASTLVAFNLSAQTADDVRSMDQINLAYAGDDSRLGIGINEDGEFITDFLKSFNSTYRSNWMFQGWYADGAGGLELDYHWVATDSEQDLIENAENYKVNKLFFAIDQNTYNDRKISVGGGQEINDKFWSVNVSTAITDERLISTVSDFEDFVLTGNIDGADYTQDQTIETITRTFERAYDWGIGGRIGKYFDSHLVRLTGGLDYEQGDFNSDQLTASVDLEKYFDNTGHSLALSVRQLKKSGDFATDKNDTRASLMYRYSFGKTFRPTERFEEVKVVDEEALAKLKLESRVVVQNEIDLSSMAFFNLDSSVLRDDAIAILKDVAYNIKSKQLGSKINIVGHTCALGTQAHNQKLSEQRATVAQDFFVSQGIDIKVLMSSGKGEGEPAFDNAGAEMEKNRRVAISFLTIEDDYKDVEIPASEVPVKWVKKPIKTAPSWLARALRNPVKHKRTVDVYKYQEQEQIETLGDIVFLNQAPSADDDALTVLRNSSATLIDVLNNDADSDNDTLTIVGIVQPANGTVVNNGSSITYTPDNGFIGNDVFEYTIDDGNENQATAQVTITVLNNAPNAVDDSATTVATAPIIIDLIGNDADSDSSTLIVKSVTQAQNGTVTNNEDGTATYVANAGFIGTDSFTYTISDEDGGESSATVRVVVEEISENTPPIAVDDLYVILMHESIRFSPLLNDSDADGDELTIISFDRTGLLGALKLNEDNTFTYKPQFMFRGDDTFTYTISDGNGGTATATVTMRVTE